MPLGKPQPLNSAVNYMEEAVLKQPELIAKIRADLKEHKVAYDTIVGTGVSGAIIVPILARALRKYAMIVRKDGQTHSHKRCEGQLGARWLFVDDLICTGATLTRAYEHITALARQESHKTKFVGAYMYHTALVGPAGYRMQYAGFTAPIVHVERKLIPAPDLQQP